MPLPWFLAVAVTAAAPPSHPLTFEEAMALAEAHPRLGAQAVGLERRAIRDQTISRLAQNPTIGVSPGWRHFDDGAGFEGIVSVSQGFSVGGVGEKGRSAAEARTRQVGARAEVLGYEIRTRVARRWLELRAVQSTLEALHDEQEVADTLVETIRRGVEAGRFLAVDLVDAEIYRAETELLRLSTEGERVDLAYRLAESLAVEPTIAVEAAGPGPAPRLPDSLSPSPWLELAGALPGVRLAVLARATRAADLAVIDANASTNLQTSLSLQREATGDVIGLVGLSVSVPLFNRGERSLSEAEYQASLSAFDADEALREAKRQVVVTLHEVEHTREISAHVEASLLPAAERYADLIERQLVGARVGVVDALRSRRRVSEERRRQIVAERDRCLAEVRAALLLSALQRSAESP